MSKAHEAVNASINGTGIDSVYLPIIEIYTVF